MRFTAKSHQAAIFPSAFFADSQLDKWGS